MRIYPKELKVGSRTYICAPMFIAAPITTAKRWEQSKCPSTGEVIKTMLSILSVEYYSTLKRKELLKHITARLKLEDTM